MARPVQFATLGGALMLLSSCFVAPSTLGQACTVDLDCDNGQSCDDGVCVAGDAETSTDTESSTTDDPSETETTEDSTDAETSDEAETTGPPLPEGSLRLIHAAPDVGPVDVYIEGEAQPLVTNLDYAEASAWAQLDTGDYVLEFRPEGADPADAPVLTSEVVTLDEDEQISAIAAGLAEGGPEDGLRVLAISEDWGTDLAGAARGRIIHAGADAPSLSVEGLDGPSFDLDRFTDSSAMGVPLDASGGERVELFAGDELLTAFTTPQLAEGDQVLLIATGLFGSLAREQDGFSLIAVGENGSLGRIRQDPQLFTLHGARDALSLDNCTNDFEVAANINYGEVQSAFLSPGDYDFDLFDYPSGCTGTQLNPGGNASGELEAGERYLLLLTGEQQPEGLADPDIQVATFRDRFDPADAVDGSLIRFVHGASFTVIYVGNATGDEDLIATPDDVYTEPIEWRSESEEVPLGEGFYLLGIADAGGRPEPPLSSIVTYDYTATAGSRQWGIVSGDPVEDGPDDDHGTLQLMLIDTATPNWDVQLVDINP